MKTFLNWCAIMSLIGLIQGCAKVAFHSKTLQNTQSCSGNGCTPYTYSWVESGYIMACSKPCGGGIQTQSVDCQRSDGVTVDDSYCSDPKPSTSQSCNVQTCTGSYSWNLGPWGVCSKPCGGGTQTRTVSCEASKGQSIDDHLCPSPQPSSSRSCNTDSCSLDTYSWQLVPNQCSKSCGGGVETYICVASDGSTVDDSKCTDPKPVVACNTQACSTSYTYSWITGSWSSCSKTCGSGSMSRSVVCQRSDGQDASASHCTDTKPSTTKTCNTQACPPQGQSVTTTVSLAAPAADIILIVDDSYSMSQDNTKLAARMAGFLSDLDASGIDYHVCVTTTDVGYYKGSPIKWGHYNGTTWIDSGSVLITHDTADKNTLFNDTIKRIGAEWSDDEQGIKALNLMVRDFRDSGCFRNKATLTAILISDENERSVGGNYYWSSVQYKPLTAENYPDNLINEVASAFNTSTYTKPFIYNSIIVMPGDTTCEATQDAQGSPSFFGTLYAQLSNETGGHVGSICDDDYTQNLRYVRDDVIKTMPSVTLKCDPLQNPQVTITPSFSTHISLSGKVMKFNPALPEGTQVRVDYLCPN